MTTLTLDYGHAEPVAVHFDDLDPMGVVHNARFALLVERALGSFWAARGHGFVAGRPTTADTFTVVREFTIRYLVPITSVGDVLVHIWLERLGTTSGVYGFRVVSMDGTTVHAEGTRVHIKLDPATLRPAPWSEAARAVADTLLAPAARSIG